MRVLRNFARVSQGRKFIFTTVEIDFYHLGVLPRMPTNQMRVHTGERLIFTTVETAFYHHRKYIGKLWFHLNSLLWPPSVVNHPIIKKIKLNKIIMWIGQLSEHYQFQVHSTGQYLYQYIRSFFMEISGAFIFVLHSSLPSALHSHKRIFTFLLYLKLVLPGTTYQTLLLMIILCLYWSHLLVIIILCTMYKQSVVFMFLDMLLLACGYCIILCIVYA